MDGAIEGYRRALGKIRTGRANLSILDSVRVDYYGTPTPLNQVAALAVPDPRLITIKPWEKSMIAEIENAAECDGAVIDIDLREEMTRRRDEA
jgi:ribosome recycling factor